MTTLELYNQITKRGSVLCYPFVYDDTKEDCLEFITRLIYKYLDLTKQLDNKSLNELNHSYDLILANHFPDKNFDFLRDVNAISQMVIQTMTKSYQSYTNDAFHLIQQFFEEDNYFYFRMIPQLRLKSGTFID